DPKGRVVRDRVIADRVQQMCLADPWRPVEIERVVGLAGKLGRGQRSSVGEAVAGPDHELFEPVAPLQRAAAGALLSRGVTWLLGLADQLDAPEGRVERGDGPR